MNEVFILKGKDIFQIYILVNIMLLLCGRKW
jgi:hypothetical protein